MRKKRLVMLLTAVSLCTAVPELAMGTNDVSIAEAHSGRTDSRGGHRDNKNKSGLGSYHYHCGGHPAHLHENGGCPYDSRYSGNSAENAPVQEPEKAAIPEHIDRVFDAAYYAEHNEDLYETFGNDAERLLEHFLTAGMKEGRVACETFNVTVYKENNEDLAQIFGDDWTAYYEHYMDFGYAENRVCY
ncbi:MAG: YHYH domain-containing protein [Lachnospirales bacterium]